MRDRLEAIGGTLTVDSSLDSGTVVTGRVPSVVLRAAPEAAR
jgi:signal transduction histidine kinase